MKRVLLYGLAGGALIALLKVVEYLHFVRTYPGEVYGGIIAAVFATLGIWLGMGRRRGESESAATEPEGTGHGAASEPTPRTLTDASEIGLTPREHEILLLIAEGLSNREIGERLFVSENTVKTHSSRLFDKMGVRRRVQAVNKAREMGFIA